MYSKLTVKDVKSSKTATSGSYASTYDDSDGQKRSKLVKTHRIAQDERLRLWYRNTKKRFRRNRRKARGLKIDMATTDTDNGEEGCSDSSFLTKWHDLNDCSGPPRGAGHDDFEF